jgi:3-methylfumaryl-CoA hydratase
MDLDIERLKTWIGREETKSELVSPTLAERFNATFDRSADASNGAVAPLLIHLCLAPPAAPTSSLGPDGHPARGGFLPPVPLPRRMWAGGAFRFRGDIRIGETVTRRSRIAEVAVKHGRSGALCFVTVEHVIESAAKPVILERQDIVYRDASSPGAPKPPQPAPQGRHREIVQPSPALLFRYSALTFNGHRIHYDVPYVREVENYPGLIVHGPLQATLLAHFAETIRGKRPSSFDFRSLSLLFDDADFTINATEDGEDLKLWTSYQNGPVAMEARAQWD